MVNSRKNKNQSQKQIKINLYKIQKSLKSNQKYKQDNLTGIKYKIIFLQMNK